MISSNVNFLENCTGSTSSHGGRTSTPNSGLEAEKLEDTTIDNIKEENGGTATGGLSPSTHGGGSHFSSSVSPLSSLINQSASSPVNSPLATLHSAAAANHLSLTSHHNLNNNKGITSLLSPTAESRNVEGNKQKMFLIMGFVN